MEGIILLAVIIWIFYKLISSTNSSSSSGSRGGETIRTHNGYIKCEKCGHNKFYDISSSDKERIDPSSGRTRHFTRYWGYCCKCGEYLSADSGEIWD